MTVRAAGVNDRIEKIREEMKKRGITMYIVPTSDFHESEYVGDYFKTRSYLTGFYGLRRNGCYYSDAGRAVDGWQIFYSGETAAERQ